MHQFVQGSDALGGPGRWAYAGAYDKDAAAQQAIVQAYQQQYNFLTACGRATDSSNTYHYAFFACSYLADVLGKGIAFDPKVPSAGARVGTVTLVRNREGEGEGRGLDLGRRSAR